MLGSGNAAVVEVFRPKIDGPATRANDASGTCKAGSHIMGSEEQILVGGWWRLKGTDLQFIYLSGYVERKAMKSRVCFKILKPVGNRLCRKMRVEVYIRWT